MFIFQEVDVRIIDPVYTDPKDTLDPKDSPQLKSHGPAQEDRETRSQVPLTISRKITAVDVALVWTTFA